MNHKIIDMLSEIRRELEEKVRIPGRWNPNSKDSKYANAEYLKRTRQAAHAKTDEHPEGDPRASMRLSGMLSKMKLHKAAGVYARKAASQKQVSGADVKKAKSEPSVQKPHEKDLVDRWKAKHGKNPPYGHTYDKMRADLEGDKAAESVDDDNIDAFDSFMADAARVLAAESGLDEDEALDFCFELAEAGVESGNLPEIPDDEDEAAVELWLSAAEETGFVKQALGAVDEVVRLEPQNSVTRGQAAKDFKTYKSYFRTNHNQKLSANPKKFPWNRIKKGDSGGEHPGDTRTWKRTESAPCKDCPPEKNAPEAKSQRARDRMRAWKSGTLKSPQVLAVVKPNWAGKETAEATVQEAGDAKDVRDCIAGCQAKTRHKMATFNPEESKASDDYAPETVKDSTPETQRAPSSGPPSTQRDPEPPTKRWAKSKK